MAVTLPSPLRVTGSATGALAGKPAPVKPTAVNPLASIFAPIDTNALAGQATGLAQANTAPIVTALQGQQAYDTKLAGQRAGLDTSASIAAAKFLQGLGLGPKLGAMYRQAGQDQAGLAAGFSGDLQRTVGDQAAHVNAGLAALGLTGAASNTSAQAGNTVYGVGGLIPANAMLASAPSAVAAANAQPAALLGVGQQAASSEIGAGAQAAARIDPQIAAALAKEPALASTYLSQFTKAAETGRQNNIHNYISQEGVDQRQAAATETHDYHAALTAAKQDQAAALAAYRGKQISIDEYKAVTTRTKDALAAVPRFDASRSRAKGYPVDQYGTPILNKAGNLDPLPGFAHGPNGTFVKSSTTSPGKFSTSLITHAATQIEAWKTGKTGTKGGVDVIDPTQKLTYSDALTHAIAQGPNTPEWRTKATQLVNAEYGTPQSIALKVAKAARQGGDGMTQTITHFLQAQASGSAAVPPQYFIQAVARVYGVSPKAVADTATELAQLIQSGQVPGG